MKKIVLLLSVLFLSLGIQAQSFENADSVAAANEPVYEVVEAQPAYPGGASAMMDYFKKNMKYPSFAYEQKIQGRAFVRFIVEMDGTISDPKVMKSAGDASLDKEAVRLVKSMPKWKPAMQQGEPVRAYYTVTVTFKR